MILLQTIASNAGFRDPSANDKRTACYRQLLSIAKECSADVLLLPGGFWTVDRYADLGPLVDQLLIAANQAEVAVIGGIDVEAPEKGKVSKTGPAVPFPWYGFVGGRTAAVPVKECEWRQTSSTQKNAWDVPDDQVPGIDRIVTIGNQTVAVMICGELFSERARKSVSELKPSLVVDLGHSGMGMGLQPAMANVARQGKCAVAHSQHVASFWTPSLHFVTAEEVQQPHLVSACQTVGDDDFWVAYLRREV